jgi:hypothetical protein
MMSRNAIGQLTNTAPVRRNVAPFVAPWIAISCQRARQCSPESFRDSTLYPLEGTLSCVSQIQHPESSIGLSRPTKSSSITRPVNSIIPIIPSFPIFISP